MFYDINLKEYLSIDIPLTDAIQMFYIFLNERANWLTALLFMRLSQKVKINIEQDKKLFGILAEVPVYPPPPAAPPPPMNRDLRQRRTLIMVHF